MQLVSRRGQSSLSGKQRITTHKLCIDYQKTSESGKYFKKVKVRAFEEPLALQVVSRERGFGLLVNQRISRLEENTEPGRLQKTDEAAENKTFSFSTK